MSSAKESDCNFVAMATVDSSGGELSAGDTASPIRGARVTFPKDALQHGVNVALGYCTESVHLASGRTSGTVLVLKVDHPQRFGAAVSISVPYDASTNTEVVIPYSLDEAGRLHVAQIVSLDKARHRLVFSTFGPGRFLWVYP